MLHYFQFSCVISVLTVAGQRYYLRADDGEDRDQWISVINDACKITVSLFYIFNYGDTSYLEASPYYWHLYIIYLLCL